MSDTAMFEQLTRDVFERPQGDLWSALVASGLARIGVSEERGGGGGGWRETAAVIATSARFAQSVPLAETSVLAGWTLDLVGLPLPDGALTLAIGEWAFTRTGGGLRISGTATRVPFARDADALVIGGAIGKIHVFAIVPRGRYRVVPGVNLAGEPRDDVTFDDVALAPDATIEREAGTSPQARIALVRTIQMSGALTRVLELTTEYVAVRKQFGRALSDFQAVQQELALLGGEVESARAAVEGAIDAVAASDAPIALAPQRCRRAVATAKIRVGLAAYEASRIAHQLHGAIGVTREHQLHRFTTRLLSWRDEGGTEREWAIRLGTDLRAAGGAGLWEFIAPAAEAMA